MECPEITALGAFAETGEATLGMREHIDGCDACQEALESLREEVLSLQIPLSELWFREHVSCPPLAILSQFRAKKLKKLASEYVEFHLEELGCPYCQARLEQETLSRSATGSKSLRQSRDRVTEATSSLLNEIRD